MKNIYINARFLSQKTTGVQRFARELSTLLKKMNLGIVWLAPANILPQNQLLASELGVLVIGTRTGHLWEQIDLVSFLRKQGNPFLVNLCNTAPLFYSNQIISIHDLAFLVYPKWFSFGFRSFYSFLIPRIAKSAKHVITVSDFSKKEILRLLNVPESNVTVIYNGVDFTKKLLTHLNSQLEERYILFVGSIDPRKNLGTLIEAMAFVPVNIKLKVIGAKAKSFNSDKISFFEGALERVEFCGYVSDAELISCYQGAICFVYPSFYEGFGLPPLEAQVLGVPIVVSDISVFHEIYKESAIFVNPNNPIDIASGINTILTMNSVELSNLKNLADVNIRRFSWVDSSEKLAETIFKYI